MPYYQTCPYCGSNLDPGERCECQKEKEAAPQHRETTSGKNTQHHSSKSQSRNQGVDSRNELKALRLNRQIPVKEMVKVVRERYPKYDRFLQSKCEHSDETGVTLLPDALERLHTAFDHKTLVPFHKPRKVDAHRQKCRISARLSNEDYAALQRHIQADGYHTTQAWLAEMVRRYLKRKEHAT